MKKIIFANLAAYFLFGMIVLNSPSTVEAQVSINNKLPFNLAPVYNTDEDTYNTAVADLDNDGNLDVIASNNSNYTELTILYGKTNGSFEPRIFLDLLGTSATTLAIGDVNNDGKADIVFYSAYSQKIAIIFNRGNRQFSTPVLSTHPAPNTQNNFWEISSLKIGDFDGDGNKDIVFLQNLLNDWRITFAHISSQGAVTVFATVREATNNNNTAQYIAVGDINGDNISDVVMSASGPFSLQQNISFILGRTDGMMSYTLGFQVQNRATGIKITDLDNDGDNDLAIAFQSLISGAVHPLQVFANAGDGTFSPKTPINFNNLYFPYDITTGDFNGDGIIDLAAITSVECLSIVYGRGNLSYGATKYYAITPSVRVFTGDFNHDNKPDILTASGLLTSFNRVSVVLNDNFSGFKAPQAMINAPSLFASADFNSDGYPDLISRQPNENEIQMRLNNYGTGGLFSSGVNYPSAYNMTDLATGDFNGDGNADVVSSHEIVGKIGIYFGNGLGTIATPVFTQISEDLKKMLIGDFNEDGKDDIFVVDDFNRGYVMLSNGDGTLSSTPESPYNNLSYFLDFKTGDFNRDGHLDIISEAGILLGNGTGQFLPSTVSFPVLHGIALADFNRDGNLDIATGSNQATFTCFFGDGSGGILQTVSHPFYGDVTSIQSIVADDFDLDGYPDVAIAMRSDSPSGLNEPGNLVVIASGGNAPSFKTPLYYGIGESSRKIIAEDFNLDGKPDLGFLGRLWGVFLNTAVRTNAAKFDFDGDNKTDISIFRPGPAEWWHLQSSDNTNRAVQFGSTSDKIVPADYTGDGKTDIAFWRPSTGEWFIIRSEDNSFYAFPFGSQGDKPVPADFDGDGKADPTVFRPSNSVWYTILSGGGGVTFQQFGISEDIPLPNDYDGDGKADFGVFRPTPSEWWILKSTGVITALQFGSTGDKPVPGDFTGDGKVDVAFWRPSTGFWYILRSEDNTFYAYPFGSNGDIPTAGDYDGDGKTDAAVFRPSNSVWYVQGSTSGVTTTQFGSAGDIPIPSAYLP